MRQCVCAHGMSPSLHRREEVHIAPRRRRVGESVVVSGMTWMMMKIMMMHAGAGEGGIGVFGGAGGMGKEVG